MPPLVPVAAAALAFAITISLLLHRWQTSNRTSAEAATRAILEKTGLSVTGSLGFYALRGRAFDVDLTLDSGTHKRPGANANDESGSSDGSLLQFTAPLPDMIVCHVGETDAIMGALPSVPRARAGHTAFDERYAAFVVKASSEYRGDGPATLGSFAEPALLDQLLDLGLQWMRVREGKVELALNLLSPSNAGRGLAVAANVVRAAQRQPLVEVPPRVNVVPPQDLGIGIKWRWILSVLVGSFLGFVLSFFEAIRRIDQEAVCGAGAILLHQQDEGNHDFHCSNNQDSALIALHVVACMILVTSVLTSGLLAWGAMRRARA